MTIKRNIEPTNAMSNPDKVVLVELTQTEILILYEPQPSVRLTQTRHYLTPFSTYGTEREDSEVTLFVLIPGINTFTFH